MSENAFKSNKLRGRIVEKFGNVSNYANAIGKNKSSVTSMLNGRVRIKREDIITFCKLLDIKNEEIVDYFFS